MLYSTSYVLLIKASEMTTKSMKKGKKKVQWETCEHVNQQHNALEQPGLTLIHRKVTWIVNIYCFDFKITLV